MPLGQGLTIFYSFISAVFAWPLGAGMYCEADLGFWFWWCLQSSNSSSRESNYMLNLGEAQCCRCD